MKWLIKLLMPSPKTVGTMAAEKIADAVNSSGKQEAIAKYSAMLKSASKNIDYINEMMVDGKIDPTETQKIASLLAVPIEKFMEMI